VLRDRFDCAFDTVEPVADIDRFAMAESMAHGTQQRAGRVWSDQHHRAETAPRRLSAEAGQSEV